MDNIMDDYLKALRERNARQRELSAKQREQLQQLKQDLEQAFSVIHIGNPVLQNFLKILDWEIPDADRVSSSN